MSYSELGLAHQDVEAFAVKMELPIGDKLTTFSDIAGSGERLRHLREEIAELHRAVTEKDVVKQVDANLDIIYLALGNLVSMGLSSYQVDECWRQVHNANMRKERLADDPLAHKQGVIKPEGWTPPAIAEVLGLKEDDSWTRA